MKITEDVRKFAEENRLSPETVVAQGLKSKAKEFRTQGAEIYQ